MGYVWKFSWGRRDVVLIRDVALVGDMVLMGDMSSVSGRMQRGLFLIWMCLVATVAVVISWRSWISISRRECTTWVHLLVPSIVVTRRYMVSERPETLVT